MNSQLGQALESVAALGAVIRPLLVAAVLFGLWKALARAALAPRQRLLAWGVVAGAMTAWLATVWILAARGFFMPGRGMIIVRTVVLVIVALRLLMRSRTIIAALDAAPLWWLIAYQAYRVAGFIFLRLWSQGLLPGHFALPAGIGDMLTGLFAALVAVALARNIRGAKALAYAVNVFGIADLLNATSIGALSAFSGASHTSALLVYPVVMVPLFGAPLAFMIHVLSIWQLRRRDRAMTASISMEMRETA